MEAEILHKLQDHAWFRERRNRSKGFAILLKRKYILNVDEKILEEVIGEASSMDRTWRRHLQDYPALRGQDYEDKKKYAQKKQINLGYEPNYYKDIKHGHTA